MPTSTFTYNPYTFNDTVGVSPRSHFITADSRDLDLRYLMLKNLPEKLKALGVLFQSDSDGFTVDSDGKIYYANPVVTADADNVLITKAWLYYILGGSTPDWWKGRFEVYGAVVAHFNGVPHLKVGYKEINSIKNYFEINYSEAECQTGYTNNPLFAASYYHMHDSRYSKVGHDHNYNEIIRTTIESLLAAYSSIEVYPYKLSKRNELGILKASDPFTYHTEDQGGPDMDMVVTVNSLRKRLQPKHIRCGLIGDPAVGTPADPTMTWDKIANLKELIEFLHPGVRFSEIDDEAKTFWGRCNIRDAQFAIETSTNSNLTIENLTSLNQDVDNAARVEFMLTGYSSITKKLGSIAIPMINFDSEKTATFEVENIPDDNGNLEGTYMWIAIPAGNDGAFLNVSGFNALKLANVENISEANSVTLNDNWYTQGFIPDNTEVARCTYQGRTYLIFFSVYRYTGELYRYALTRYNTSEEV